MEQLAGRAAVVTGAAIGIGAGIASALAEEGMRIMAADRADTQRSRLAIHAALATVSLKECADFDAEFAQVLARASTEFDLPPAE